MISFTVPGEPVAKGRAKVTTINGFARMYTPTKTVSYESTVALFASQAMAGRKPLDGPVSLSVHAVFAIPASWTKKRLQAHLVSPEYVVKRPDGDNLLKAVSDALNGICFKDDAQVADGRVIKVYGDQPRVDVTVGVIA
jgi:Holliday junction resolvase RusA-like endonuclease